jgi:hypothetical protein
MMSCLSMPTGGDETVAARLYEHRFAVRGRTALDSGGVASEPAPRPGYSRSRLRRAELGALIPWLLWPNCL